ncbi:MAG TPA: hypothetical protein EYP98_15635, partial [Planctomycetes bacterium]|nr:hypothetical protein [Planctomycetota bacterium]
MDRLPSVVIPEAQDGGEDQVRVGAVGGDGVPQGGQGGRDAGPGVGPVVHQEELVGVVGAAVVAGGGDEGVGAGEELDGGVLLAAAEDPFDGLGADGGELVEQLVLGLLARL